MSLSNTEIATIRASFAALRPDTSGAARSFYSHLFTLAPEVRGLFKSDMAEQGPKLMAMLGVVVGHLHVLEEILPAVRALAIRHVGYGTEPAHYAVVGQALDRMLADRLEPILATQARVAWAKAYGLLANVMIEAAEDATPAV
ncbi:MAG: globin domain-containing protein [Pseudomonadota bacterium]